LFGELVPRLTAHPENAASDALAYVLTASVRARAAVSSLLTRHGVTPVGDIHFLREVTGETGERPDLAVSDQTGSEIALLEVKFWAGFTDNQPMAYLTRLRGESSRALVFVVPDNRVPSAWRHVTDALRQAGSDFTESSSSSSGMRTGTSANISILLVSWRSLLGSIQDHLQPVADADTLADLHQLRGLVDRMEEDQFLPLHPSELSSGIARRHIQLSDLFTRVMAELVAAGLCERSRFDTGNSGGLHYGTNISLNEVGFWVGFWYRPWRDLVETPFWLQLLDEEKSPGTINALRPLTSAGRLIEENGNWLIPLRIRTGVERDDVVADLVDQVRSVAALLQT
jgi:hypothetical protein